MGAVTTVRSRSSWRNPTNFGEASENDAVVHFVPIRQGHTREWSPFLWCTGGEGPFDLGDHRVSLSGIGKTVRRYAVVNTRMDELVWLRNQLQPEGK